MITKYFEKIKKSVNLTDFFEKSYFLPVHKFYLKMDTKTQTTRQSLVVDLFYPFICSYYQILISKLFGIYVVIQLCKFHKFFQEIVHLET